MLNIVTSELGHHLIHHRMMRLHIIVVGIISCVLTLRSVFSGSISTPAESSEPEIIANYNYGDATLFEEREVFASKSSLPRLIQEAHSQWPATPAGKARALIDRLERVSGIVNAQLDSHYVVALGETGRTAVSSGNGLVTVDSSIVWRLSEDALACLIAHEFAHEYLGHSALRSGTPRRGPGSHDARQLRDLELEADKMAGATIARTPYRPNGFTDLLKLTRDTAWMDPLVREYYPHEERWKAFKEGFENGLHARFEIGFVETPAYYHKLDDQ